jgi:hypothetical protein
MARTRYDTEPVVDRRVRGLDIPATIGGLLAAIATLAILGGIAGAAIGGTAADRGVTGNLQEITMASLIVGVVVLFVSFLVGGWVAGRMSRFDGGRNGAFIVLWALLLGGILAALGAWLGDQYNVTARVNLPGFFDADTFTASAIIGALVTLGAMLLGGFLGGRIGDRYHRRVDDSVAPVGYTAPVATRDDAVHDDVVHRQDATQTVPADTTARGETFDKS